MKPILAIIGRPNVGKSTLFNRIVGRRKALTHDRPGVTRDRNFATAEWSGREFLCVDTGGFPVDDGTLDDKVSDQIDLAIEESDVIVCVMDGEAGAIPEEEKIVARLRKIDKPVYYVVNKIDVPAHEARLNDFYQLGIDKPYPVSAEHGYQVAELLDSIVSEWPQEQEEPVLANQPIKVAIVGRPNVGKSSLVNAILGESRVVVDPMPGTTRDSIDTSLDYDGHTCVLIDTAGMRRRSQKGGFLEKLTVLHATRAIDRSNICLLILSAEDGLLKQDAHIAGYIDERSKGLIVVWNKMDLKTGAQKELAQTVQEDLPFLSDLPLQFISALKQQGISELMTDVIKLHQDMGCKIATSQLNKVFSNLVEHHSIPLYKGREVKLYYATQVATYPPRFVVFSNWPQGVPDSYRRYLIHGLKERLDMKRIPVRVVFRKRK